MMVDFVEDCASESPAHILVQKFGEKNKGLYMSLRNFKKSRTSILID